MGHFTEYIKRLPAMRNRTPDLEYTPAGVSDDFTGNDGDPPDTRKWDVNSGPITIQSNKLDMDIPYTGVADILSMYANWKLSGNFDIQIIWNEIARQQTQHNSLCIGLWSYPAYDEWWTDQIYLTTPTKRHYTSTHLGGSSPSWTDCYTEIENGWGITRVSGVVKIRQWVKNASYPTGAMFDLGSSPYPGSDSTADVRLRIWLTSTDPLQPSSHFTFDDFVVNSGTVLPL